MTNGHKSRKEIYIKGISISFIARIAIKASGLVVLYFLNRILTKAEFGEYSIAFQLITILTVIGGAGLDRSLLYRVAPLPGAPEEIKGHAIASSTLYWSLIIGGGLSLIMVLLSAPIANLYALPGLQVWLVGLSIIIPLDLGRLIYSTWLQSCQRVAQATFIDEFVLGTLKVFAFLLVWLLDPSTRGVILGFLATSGIIFIHFFIRFPLKPSLKEVGKSDFLYGIQLIVVGILKKLTLSIDILMLGIYVDPSLVAEYAIATRLAIYASIPFGIATNVLLPRMRIFIHDKNLKDLTTEYYACQVICSISVILGMVIIPIFGTEILNIFGDYGSVAPLLVLLLAVGHVGTSTGPNGMYLHMSGYATTSLVISLIFLVVSILLNALAIPRYGILGAAMATLISLTLLDITISTVIYLKDHFKTYSTNLFITTGAVVIISVLYSSKFLDWKVTAGAFLITGLFLLFMERKIVFTILKSLKQMKASSI